MKKRVGKNLNIFLSFYALLPNTTVPDPYEQRDPFHERDSKGRGKGKGA